MEYKKNTNIFRPILLLCYRNINREIYRRFQTKFFTQLLENDEKSEKNRYMYFVYDTTSDDMR